jgi:hypothetical protein
MPYQMPPRSPGSTRQNPIFPWEEHAPKPTRVFPVERSPSPEPVIKTESEAHRNAMPSREGSGSSDDAEISGSDSNTPATGDPWNKYSRTNAWDSVPEIERYVRSFAQGRRAKVEVIHQSQPSDEDLQDSITSPIADASRRPSMRLTDFPTEAERPSLPVTPAPRRPSFWGEERNAAGELPPAEGVPKQQDWVRLFQSLLIIAYVYRNHSCLYLSPCRFVQFHACYCLLYSLTDNANIVKNRTPPKSSKNCKSGSPRCSGPGRRLCPGSFQFGRCPVLPLAVLQQRQNLKRAKAVRPLRSML